ncbi:MAG: tRNA pseudouridine(38-40) synthase TruA [Verrucomicrobiales bacterium]|jgi:tRNA pseudouridine38-40 synthase|nr:tRNA pseudouridine(38-40) synthase TruA [Verrucomicrobiales bacterium]
MKIRNHKLTVSYDGTLFKGWQIQANPATVQGHLERVLARCWGERITLHGSGRTDSGVHADAQIAHFKAAAKFKSLSALQAALNHHLPPQIRVTRAQYADDDFHARFSAKGKEYRYRICNHPFQDPFEINRSWHIPRPLNITEMKKAARLFVGEHDFASFTSNPGYARATTVRRVTHVSVSVNGPLITVSVRGAGFLYRMVRNIVGALVTVGLGRLTASETRQILNAKCRGVAPNTAPAHGLYLHKVFYKTAAQRTPSKQSQKLS